MSTPKRVQTRNGIQGIVKAMALKMAAGYCINNGLSIEKLSNLLLFIIDDSIIFAAPSKIPPKGLINDIETQPIPVLIAYMNGNDIYFQQTQYTNEYIKA